MVVVTVVVVLLAAMQAGQTQLIVEAAETQAALWQSDAMPA